MAKKSGSGGGSSLGEGLSHKSTFNAKEGGAKPTSNGRASKRPTTSAGVRGLKIKGQM